MKLICSKSNLLYGVNTVSKAVPTRTTMAILECILIDASSNEIKLTANDMELGIETVIDGTIEENGIIALDAKIFSDIVRKLPDNDVVIETDDSFKTTITCEAEQREQREAMERSLTRDEERIEVLDKLVMRLYEDMVAGRISEQNFNTMLEKTQTEQTELKARVSEGRKRLSDEVQLANDAKQWVEAIQEYANITELDAAILNRLIKEIVVHERIDDDKTRHISIEIHFNLKPIPEVEQVTA